MKHILTCLVLFVAITTFAHSMLSEILPGTNKLVRVVMGRSFSTSSDLTKILGHNQDLDTAIRNVSVKNAAMLKMLREVAKKHPDLYNDPLLRPCSGSSSSNNYRIRELLKSNGSIEDQIKRKISHLIKQPSK